MVLSFSVSMRIMTIICENFRECRHIRQRQRQRRRRRLWMYAIWMTYIYIEREM